MGCKNKKDNCNKKDDCRKKELLKKYHKLIEEANELYRMSDCLVDKQVIEGICFALKNLNNAIQLNEKADEKIDNANCILDKLCIKIPCKCQKSFDAAMANYAKENEFLADTLCLLEKALENIKKSIKARECANANYCEFVKCVHHKDCDC